jgi:hypothetical protein
VLRRNGGEPILTQPESTGSLPSLFHQTTIWHCFAFGVKPIFTSKTPVSQYRERRD